MEKQVMQSRSKGASVWVDGWMDGWIDVVYSLRHWFSFSNHPCLSLFFLRHGYPFSLSYFFLGHASLACHLFSFWGNHNLTLFYFRDVLQESLPRHGSFIDGKLMDLVCVYDRESMKSISLGSHNLTKLNRTSSSICVRFFVEFDIWLW